MYIFTYPISIILDKILGIHEKTRMEKMEIIGLVELAEINKEENKHGKSDVYFFFSKIIF